MRIAYAILSSLLLLGGCATTGMGPHGHGAEAQPMQNCPMVTGDQQHGAMMGDHAGQMMNSGPMMQGQTMQGQTMPGMHQGDMANCPMAQGAAPPAPPPPADPHPH